MTIGPNCTVRGALSEQLMAHHWTPRGLHGRGIAALTPYFLVSVLALLPAASFALVAALVPRAAVLPALSLVAIAIAVMAATAAWWRKANRDAATITLWDVAGAFMLIGFAAAIMSQPENLMQVFGHTDKP
jgi:hypothetical protein